MKASTLVVLIVLYAIAGIVTAFVTGGNGWIAFATGAGLALTLGAGWPVHRGFPIVGIVLGLAISAIFFTFVAWMASLFPEDVHLHRAGVDYVLHLDRTALLVRGLWMSAALFGGWMFFLLTGAGATWLWQRLAPRREVPLRA